MALSKLATIFGATLLLAYNSAVAAELTIGQVAPLTGPTGSQARAYGEGMKLYFNAINKAGGVGGNTLTLVQKDDGNLPELTVSQTKQLIAERRPIVLAGYFGSRNLASLQADGILRRERLAIVGIRNAQADPGAAVYSVRATSADEVRKIVNHVATVGITRVALFHEIGAGAEDTEKTVREALSAAGGQLIASSKWTPGQSKVDGAVAEMLQAKPQAIILAARGSAIGDFVERYRLGGGAAQLFATSEADYEQLVPKLADEHLQGLSIAQVMPNPYKISNRLTREFRDAVGASVEGNVVSYSMMEGYVAAKVIVEVLRRLRNVGNPDAMLNAIENLGRVDLGGFAVHFAPGGRTGSQFVELSIISAAGRIRQ